MWDLSSRIKDQTHVPCVAREILNHWTNSFWSLPHLLLTRFFNQFSVSHSPSRNWFLWESKHIIFSLILSSYSFFLSLSPLSSPFPLCTEWPCLLVCWEESHLTPADPVSHQASVSFNPQKGPDLDSTVCDQNSLNSSLLHHTHILYTYYILLGAGNTDLSKRFQSSEHQTPNSYWNCQKNIIIKRHIIAGNPRKVPFSYNKLQGISPRYIAGETGLRGGSAMTGVSSAFVSYIFFRRKATQGPVEVTPLACPSSEQWETGDDAGDPQFSSTMHRVLQDFQGHHSSAHLFEAASSTRGGHLREAEETLD